MPEIHCDLGEGEAPEITQALMRWVDAVSIACGGHAGDDATMASCLRLARMEGVSPGAHPGIPDRRGFGRTAPATFGPADLESLLHGQLNRIAAIAHETGVQLRHIKLHGALYHLVDEHPALGQAYLRHVSMFRPDWSIVTRAGGFVLHEARRLGLKALGEGFLDRGYRADGTLVPRGESNALIHDPAIAIARLRSLRDRGGWTAVEGTWIPLAVDALCVHGDSPSTLTLLQRLREVFPRDASKPERSSGGP